MKKALIARAAILTVAVSTAAASPLAHVTEYTHLKNGKVEARRVQLARQPDGSVRRTMRYRLYNCIDVRCDSPQCVCRCGAKRQQYAH